jgi:hypothetical protein
MRFRLLLCAAMVWLGASSALAVEPAAVAANQTPKFELKDGDRVVFLGNTLIEREQKYGYWELMLTMAWPERNVTFRNLGWSGDTVLGESRAGFGTQADGFKKLVEEVNAAKPTVIFVGYGNVEAFAGEAGLPKFIEGFGKLLDVLEATKARIVVLGPTLQHPAITPNKQWKVQNDNVRRYSAELEQIATKRNAATVHFAKDELIGSPFLVGVTEPTTNGIDQTWFGYVELYGAISHALSIPTTQKFTLDLAGRAGTAYELLDAIQKKNELFFHRWRPQNETYLFGFRKHEQGKNAAEVFQFDPLVEAEEKKIAELRVKLAAEMKKNGGAK